MGEAAVDGVKRLGPLHSVCSGQNMHFPVQMGRESLSQIGVQPQAPSPCFLAEPGCGRVSSGTSLSSTAPWELRTALPLLQQAPSPLLLSPLASLPRSLPRERPRLLWAPSLLPSTLCLLFTPLFISVSSAMCHPKPSHLPCFPDSTSQPPIV